MPNFFEYNPEQAYLLPPSVRDVLRENHLCFFVHRAVEKLDLRPFEASYSDEGHAAYHPALRLKVWLYAYALGMTSSRRLEQRVREDLAFRYLAGGAQPDFWALNEFRKRRGPAMNDVFTQVVEFGALAGNGKAGACGHRFQAHCRQCVAQRDRQSGKAACGTSADPQTHSALAAAVCERRSQRRGRVASGPRGHGELQLPHRLGGRTHSCPSESIT
jgi:transposase